MVSRKVLALLGIVLVCGTTLAYAQKAAAALTAQDFVEIQQLYAKYNWTLDAGDAEGYASTFTADGVFNNNVGHDAIVKFAETFHAGLGAHVRHWNTNPADAGRRAWPGVSGAGRLRQQAGDHRHVRELFGRPGEDRTGLALQEARDQRRRRAAGKAAVGGHV